MSDMKRQSQQNKNKQNKTSYEIITIQIIHNIAWLHNKYIMIHSPLCLKFAM